MSAAESLPTADPRIRAARDMLVRTGIRGIQLRRDEREPSTWTAIGLWHVGADGQSAAGGESSRFDAAAGMTAPAAVIRLLDQALEGGCCKHCGRPTGAAAQDYGAAHPLGDLVCWYAYDPTSETFRRSCEKESA